MILTIVNHSDPFATHFYHLFASIRFENHLRCPSWHRKWHNASMHAQTHKNFLVRKSDNCKAIANFRTDQLTYHLIEIISFKQHFSTTKYQFQWYIDPFQWCEFTWEYQRYLYLISTHAIWLTGKTTNRIENEIWTSFEYLLNICW